MSIQVRPKLKYQVALEPSGVEMGDFNGFAMGIGVSIHYRFGEDPDSASALIRSLRLADSSVSSVFAALQSYYIDNPIGSATIENRESSPIENIEVAFFQPGLMDAPTPCVSLDTLDSGAIEEIPLYAFFNDHVFNTEGVTPYTGEIIVQYEYRRRPAEQRFSVSYDLHDKTAMTWDDDRKVAAYITPADSALRNYSSFVRQSVKEEALSSFNKPLQEGMQIFNALAVLGCLYQSDPSSPFTSAQENAQVVDSVSLPRDTLKRITGDCDDLTVLYCSLLETLGIETAYVTVPGHIYAAFNTKIPSSDYRDLHGSRDMTISLNGELWVPVEITMIGVSGFPEAWRKGAAEWHALDDRSGSRGFYETRSAQETFRPVGLKETDLGLQYGTSREIAGAFRRDLREIQESILASYEEQARSRGKKQDYNQLGVKYSLFERYADARGAFERAVSLDRDYLPAQINQANLEFLQGHHEQALKIYEIAKERLERLGKGSTSLAGKLLLNMARSYYEAGALEEAKSTFTAAEALVPGESRKFAYLGSSDESGSRASGIGLETGMIFVEDLEYEE